MLTDSRSPMALITPAKSHPEVIIHAVAARDKTRATTFARKYDIPVVKNSYDGAPRCSPAIQQHDLG